MPKQLPRFYGITGAPNPAYGALAAIICAVYICRDRSRSQLNDPLKRWERLPGIIRDAAGKADPDAPIESFVSNLCKLVDCPTIAPRVLAWIVRPDATKPVFCLHLPSSGESQSRALPSEFENSMLPIAFGYLKVRDGVVVDELIEPDIAQKLAIGNFAAIAQDACNRMGCEQIDLVEAARKNFHAIASFVRLKMDEIAAFKQEPPELEAIEVQINA